MRRKSLFIAPIMLTISILLCSANIEENSPPSSSFSVASAAIDEAWYLSSAEKNMLRSINSIRTAPQKYLAKVEAAFNSMLEDSASLKQQTSEIISTEWVYLEDEVVKTTDTTYRNHFDEIFKAYVSLIQELKNAKPLNPLLPHLDLKLAAQQHAADQAPSEYIQHYGTDGSWPLDRITRSAKWCTDGNENIAAGMGDHDAILLQLMVDSGVKGYGHRKNILNPDWTHVSCHKVEELSTGNFSWWIQEFAR